MRSWLLRTAVRRSLVDVRHVTPVRPGAARGPLADLYRQVEQEFGVLAPPVVLHSPEPTALAACWAMLRESLVAGGRVDRAAKEAVAAAVSRSNTCPYCVEVHGSALRALAGAAEAAAVTGGRADEVTDPVVRDLTRWAGRAHLRDAADDRPFPPAHAPEIVGVVVTFHYINRMVNVFLTDSPLPAFAPPTVRAWLLKLLRATVRRTVALVHPPGAAAHRLPAAARPADLDWAQGDEPLADAFARAYAAIDRAGARALDAPVRAVVEAELDRWDGQPTGLSRSWTQPLVAVLPEADRPAARLALLAALASYQVDDTLIADVRAGGLDDADLVALVAWASLAAARRIGARAWQDARAGHGVEAGHDARDGYDAQEGHDARGRHGVRAGHDVHAGLGVYPAAVDAPAGARCPVGPAAGADDRAAAPAGSGCPVAPPARPDGRTGVGGPDGRAVTPADRPPVPPAAG
ncbi:carboxymuconolactone decarboxylase family protein [Micromonospora sp. WMMD882]|uniref:carboxymuconolactone decarboxylase family protein n=1 Tax=Micromonospora sp. WMMD882 TaxID=3015151 RepID=UPI00248B7F92|nr:carboxymuconolactone decarboxylase family protein [Micromonospora sp. WMMD882]WBB80687.1 carboxymuconolactone decarboxylase family protein [Micromonospora sp. WMMD882]